MTTEVTELQTPCLLLEQSRLLSNLERMRSMVGNRQVSFRPHLKTAKSPDVARLCSNVFGAKVMVSTLREAEMLQGCGLTDFLYSVAIVPGKFERAALLAGSDGCLTVAVDNRETAVALAEFCDLNEAVIRAVIELDLDGHRSGVGYDDAAALLEIGQALDFSGLLRGVMSHAGSSYALSDEDALQACARQEAEKTLHAAGVLRAAGMDCELVSIGSTPTTISGQHYPGVNELRAGVFMFFDLVQAGVGVCTLGDIALSVLTAVISCNPDKRTLVVDAGWMALSRDLGTSRQAIDYGYGQVCDVHGTVLDGLVVIDSQQEHGMIGVRRGSLARVPDLKPGTLLRILPNHACATAAQHDRYHLVGPGPIIEAIWPRFGGW